MSIAKTNLFSFRYKQQIKYVQLSLVNALHVTSPGYQVVLRAGHQCFLSVPWAITKPSKITNLTPKLKN